MLGTRLDAVEETFLEYNAAARLQVAGSEYEDSRLLLCEATALIMRQTFKLLGITPLYRI